MPDRLPPLEYPDRFEVRYVSANGGIRWIYWLFGDRVGKNRAPGVREAALGAAPGEV
jgi:hypothetical protein